MASWSHNRPPQLVKPGPGGLVTTQPNCRCNPGALTPCFSAVTHHMARNQVRSGLRVPSKIVPAVMEVWCWQAAQRKRFRPVAHACPLHRADSGTRMTTEARRHSLDKPPPWRTAPRTPEGLRGSPRWARARPPRTIPHHVGATYVKWIAPSVDCGWRTLSQRPFLVGTKKRKPRRRTP